MDELHLDFDVIFGVLSGRVSTAINRKLYRDFRQAGIQITPEQWMILLSLYHLDGITQQELAMRTNRDKPGITRLINNLERQFLVVRMADKKDRRINLISITKAGRQLQEKARIIALQSMKDALSGISEEELRVGEILMKKIIKNLS